jgi:hypothetical protein
MSCGHGEQTTGGARRAQRTPLAVPAGRRTAGPKPGRPAIAADPPDRRRDPFGRDLAYFVDSIGGDIPGLGSAFGIGGTVLNMFDTDADFTGFNIQGDFDASGYTLLERTATSSTRSTRRGMRRASPRWDSSSTTPTTGSTRATGCASKRPAAGCTAAIACKATGSRWITT